MIVEGLAIGELPGETVGAMNGFGRKVVGAVQGHQQLVAQNPKMRQHAVLFKTLKDLKKHGLKMARRDGIEQLCGPDCHRGSALRQAASGRYCALWLCCSRRWYSKNDGDWVKKIPKAPKTASWMAYRVLGPLFAMVRQVSELSVQDVLKGIEA